ncbi:hypothetical protein ACSE3M_10090 [Bacillus velezensis]
MEEAYTQCDRIAILNNGQFAAIGSPIELIQTYCPQQRLFLKYAGEKVVAQLKNIPDIKNLTFKHYPPATSLKL